MSRVTLKDVSTRAGVSRSTASLVLRGSDRISPATRDRVRAAMEELGYVYDRAAANLRQSRTMTVGLVMTDLRNPFFAELTMAAEHELHEAGYTLFIGYSRDDAARQDEIISALVERRVDGLIYLPAAGTDRSVVDRLARQGVPAVLFARHLDGAASYVGPDNFEAGRLLGAHLRAIGIRDAVFLGGATHTSAHSERLAGLRAGVEGRVEIEAHTSDLNEPTSAAGVALVSELLDSGRLPDCIVAYNDIIAIGVSAGLRQRGFEPGKAIAVAGFDDIEATAQQVPPLTSVATHAEQVGAACARRLLGLLAEAEGRPVSGTPVAARAAKSEAGTDGTAALTSDGIAGNETAGDGAATSAPADALAPAPSDAAPSAPPGAVDSTPVLIAPSLKVRASTGSWRPRREIS